MGGLPRHLEPIPVHQTFFAQNYLVSRQDWRERLSADEFTQQHFTPHHRPQTYAGYIEQIAEIDRLLRQRYPLSTRVYAIDFPSYLFSLSSGFAIPRGTAPWLLYGHEISNASATRIAQWVLKADVVVVGYCSLHKKNRAHLVPLVKPMLKSSYQEVQRTPCWSIHERRLPPLQHTTAS